MSAVRPSNSQASSPKAELEDLLGLITSATMDAIAIYEKSGHGIPSINSTTTHPLDIDTTLALKKAIRILDAASEQLCTTLAPPSHTLLNRSMSHMDPAAMRIAIEARIPDLLVEHPQGLSIKELAKKTGMESWKLRKIMRTLATRHCFREVAPDMFANNRVSLALVNSPGADLILLMTGEVHEASFSLPYALKDTQFGSSDDPTKSALMYFHKGIQGTAFDYFRQHPARLKIFDSAMMGLTDHAALVHDFPWECMPAGTTFCDVGGGTGGVLIPLAKVHRHLKLTLQDQPNVIEKARSVWGSQYPEAVSEKRIDFVPFDFFKESPVKGQNIYYTRHCIHNWPDADAVVILKNIRQAMGSDSRLLIHEFVLQNLHEDKSTGARDAALAPKPLLPNYGYGNIIPHYQDINMLGVMNSGQRSLDDFKALGNQAGLAFVKLWDFAENALLEFKRA